MRIWRVRFDNLGALMRVPHGRHPHKRACLGAIDLVELACLAELEDRPLLERKIEFLSHATREIDWVQHRIDTDEHQEETAEMISLSWQIWEMIQLAELHIEHGRAL